MFSFKKIERTILAIVLITTISFPNLLFSQHDSYAGKETKLTTSELLLKAEQTDFNKTISQKVFEDEKNTYYAVDVSLLSSKYEKIRLLELSYADKILVSIGTDNEKKYYFFLVNNTLEKSADEINNLFDSFSTQSKTELQSMNDEQKRLWLIQHDKYTIK